MLLEGCDYFSAIEALHAYEKEVEDNLNVNIERKIINEQNEHEKNEIFAPPPHRPAAPPCRSDRNIK